MISAIIPFVLSVVTAATPAPAPAATGAEPAIRVTLNHQNYDRGDRARVTVRVRDDGYVVVLHEDANGHVRVLFPVDPGDDNFLKAGQDYEIRGRGDRDAFQVTANGSGTVYAAVALDPYHFDNVVRNNHWDYAKLDGDDSAASNSAEATMTSIVEQMADGNHFDYDLTTYVADDEYASTSRPSYVVPVSTYGCFYGSWDPWCDGYYPSPTYYSSFGFDIGFGFGPFWGYRGFGYPYRYAYGYPYYYGYGRGYGYGYPVYYGGYYGRGYGSAGYGYTIGRGWTYRNRSVVLGPNGGQIGGPAWGLGSTVAYRNRGALVNTRGASPLYGVSRFNTQRSPTRGIDSPNRLGGRRDVAVNGQTGFRTRIGGTRPSDASGSRPTRVDGAGQSRANGGSNRPTRVEPRGDSRPTRVEPRGDSRPTRAEPRGDSRPTRVEPRSEPRSERRAEPRSEGRSRAPESRGGGSRSGGGGGGGGRRSGGGGGGHHH